MSKYPMGKQLYDARMRAVSDHNAELTKRIADLEAYSSRADAATVRMGKKLEDAEFRAEKAEAEVERLKKELEERPWIGWPGGERESGERPKERTRGEAAAEPATPAAKPRAAERPAEAAARKPRLHHIVSEMLREDAYVALCGTAYNPLEETSGLATCKTCHKIEMGMKAFVGDGPAARAIRAIEDARKEG